MPSDNPFPDHEISRPSVPLSFAQQRLWFLDRLEGPNATYNIPLALRLTGHLDPHVLKSALADVVNRHESLRTVFPDSGDTPWQGILAPEAAQVVMECSALDETGLPAALAQAAAHCFDLAREIPIRAHLFRLEAQSHVLLLLVHHIAGDGWSMLPLARDLGIAYAARKEGQAPQWQPLPVQYADYTLWQRELLGDDKDPDSLSSQQIEYWREALAGLPDVHQLKLDRPRPPVASHRGDSFAFHIDAALHDRLLKLARANQATLFMVLQASLAALLTRLGAGTDIALGSPIAGRTDEALHDLIGYFANTLVLRTDTSGNPTFRELLAQARKTDLEAYRRQDLPFDRLVDVLRPARSLAHQPLFQIMLALQNHPETGFDLPGLQAVVEPVAVSTAKFDLLFNIMETPGVRGAGKGLSGTIEYATDLFDPDTIVLLAKRFQRVLEAVATTPDMHIWQIEMLDGAEQHQLQQWNATRSDYPKDKTIHQVFEEQAAKTPDQVAVVFEGEELTYAQLNDRANRLAHYLVTQGVGPDVLVGLCVERSLEMIVGLLGILKSGGAYLPLDPAYPVERLEYMLADARPAVLLTQQHLQQALPGSDIPRFCLDSQWNTLGSHPERNLESLAQPANLAYVIYTSGSTGKPKGVAVSHRNVLRLVKNANYFAPEETRRVLQFASVTFDACTFETWATLLNGASLIIAAPGPLSLEQLGTTIVTQRIDTLWLTAGLFNQMVEHQLSSLMSARHVLAGGEALSVHHVQRFIDASASTRLTNGYGPTESTTFACCHPVPPRHVFASSIPIGKPISNTQAYILDAFLNPAPIGVAGELHIGGDGVARGYLYRPDLTAEKFIPDPFSGEPGARMYRSGDLARYLPDGNIEYLGRIDNQVKLRGFRIEPGEIEAALTALPAVRDAVVLVREDAPGDRRLVAYVVAGTDAILPEAAALRAALLHSLAEYMVPAHFVMLDQLPLTVNGKIDRKALPAPDMSRSGSDYEAPSTPIEEKLACIWAEVLKLERVGIRDNFFAVGGHSLLATQVMAKMRLAFHVDLSLRCLFEAATVEALAKRVEQARQGGARSVVSAIGPVERGDAVPLSFVQQRLWFTHEHMAGRKTSYNMFVTLRLRKDLSIDALRSACNALVERHEILRTTFVAPEGHGDIHGDEAVQCIAPSLTLDIPVIDTDEAGIAQHCAAHADHVFDLASGPLIRFCLLNVKNGEPVLMLGMHHIIADGWSLGVLKRDLQALYTACVTNRPASLPALSIQYADYACWQRQQDLSAHLAYWKEALAGYQDGLELPYDFPRPPQRVWRAAAFHYRYPAALSQRAARFSREQEATLFMTLLSALAIVLHQYTGRTDLCIGTTTAGRDQAGLEELIGFFINILPLRIDLSGDPSGDEIVQRVKAAALSGFEHQALPFEHLLSALQLQRDDSRIPLVPVMLRHQNFPMDASNFTLFAESEKSLTGSLMQGGQRFANSELDLQFFGDGSSLEVVIEYATGLFSEETIERLVHHHRQVLEMLISESDHDARDDTALAA